jgi:Reverse transcriptase (RNA-dependent DNA polymerase)
MEVRRSNAATNDVPKYKFGELVPQNSRHAMHIDRANGNTAWQDAIDTELKQINDYQKFQEPNPGELLESFQKIPYHLVFDVKFDLRKKEQLVAGGHKTAPPKEDLYSGVVDLFTVRLGQATGQLQVCAADVGNDFLYGTTKEKVYIIAGPEFGPLAGKPLIIDHGLYGLKSSSTRFHEHLSAKLRSMVYRPTKADTDFWIKYCGQHYEYIATYVDDVLVYSKNPMKIIEELQRDYILKGIGVPRYYLGGDVLELEEKWQQQENPIITALSAETYIGNAIDKY